MSKTYTLYPTAMYTGFKRRGGYHHANWDNIEYTINSGAQRKVGDNNDIDGILWSSMFFDSTTLAHLRTCNVTSMTLTFIYNDTDRNGNIAVRYKDNPTTTSFTSANQTQTDAGSYNIITAYASSSPGSWNISNYEVPKYGFVIGPNGNPALQNNWIRIDMSSSLVVVTDENDYSYTLAYDANGGFGAPSDQTGSNTQSSPSYTFTISSTEPVRTGYDFLGWSTSSTATSASYQPGGTITVTQSDTTTLYAVWKALNTIKVVNSAGTGLDTYLVYIVESNTLVPYRVTVVNSAGTDLDSYI